MKYKLLATDIDGTLTINRDTTLIDPEVINYMRALERNGVIAVLVSSNASASFCLLFVISKGHWLTSPTS